MTTLIHLLSQYGAASLDKQESLASLIGNADWQFSMDTGRLTFGGRHVFPAQVLGTEAEASQTWLWGWANAASGIPAPLLQASHQMQAYGEQNGVAEFASPEFLINGVNGHLLSMIAVGLCGADAYYRGPYEGGAVFLLMTAPQLKAQSDNSVPRVIRIYTAFISQFLCDHREALMAYARYKGYSCESNGSEVVCASPRGEPLRATFDHLGRNTQITAQASPAGSPADKKPWWKPGR